LLARFSVRGTEFLGDVMCIEQSHCALLKRLTKGPLDTYLTNPGSSQQVPSFANTEPPFLYIINESRPIYVDADERFFGALLDLLERPQEFDLLSYVKEPRDVVAFRREMERYGGDEFVQAQAPLATQLNAAQAMARRGGLMPFYMARGISPSTSWQMLTPDDFVWVVRTHEEAQSGRGVYVLHIDTDAYLFLLANAAVFGCKRRDIINMVIYPEDDDDPDENPRLKQERRVVRDKFGDRPFLRISMDLAQRIARTANITLSHMHSTNNDSSSSSNHKEAASTPLFAGRVPSSSSGGNSNSSMRERHHHARIQA
jgi:hypothetical protein